MTVSSDTGIVKAGLCLVSKAMDPVMVELMKDH